MSYDNKFSLDTFKRWMKDHKDDHQIESIKPKNGLIGVCVESKIGLKRFVAKISSDDGNVQELAQEFVENGGTIADTEDKTFLIEVDSGSFRIHRCYVKRA